jgi:hypothetical protein
MSECEIVMVDGSEGTSSYPCGLKANDQCCDCGAMLCELHSDLCDICQEIYCSMCLLFHMDQPHAKPNVPVRNDDVPRRRRA